MKKVTRTIESTVVNYVTVDNSEGTPKMVEHEPVTFEGKLNEKKAKKELAKTVEMDFLITGIDLVSNSYEMDIELFMQQATIKEDYLN